MGGSIVSPTLLSACVVVLWVVCSLKDGNALGRTATVESHTIQLTSLLPSSICSSGSATQGSHLYKSSTSMVHALSSIKIKQIFPLTLRFSAKMKPASKSICPKLAKNVGRSTNLDQSDAANLPAKDGSVVGVGNYVVSVGLGTPKKDLTLIFDTGSDITWTQCQPCARSCYKQQDQIFAPSLSSSYSNISCTSTICNSFTSATGNSPGCSSTACVYGIQYGDSSFSIGIFAKEKLSLTPTDVLDDFLFDCGQNNQASVFTAGGDIIDSGTVITRLPLTAYSALSSEFRKLMSQYPTAQTLSILDTCYDFTKYSSISVPKISVFFGGGVEDPIPV
ncbi:hypothetical protein F3Y22_tig00002793pilonHSYRG00205 [Hibiscus syriacus]|uniref:Peptidase A1 domain-containing protein n=1 Tax=Hibiscus syriacus TaxID=106335 RepID=A0A6A3CWD4_HIBSY|nr:hypothetical protein F3Y22_tig00002793pilonHSYRG00205 [Hibiscus syriacus]